ncbi:MAG: hypothetical protein IJR89_06545 [Clostridia bacterium]|nr:hypothetical protein [Clostridia bacterium]
MPLIIAVVAIVVFFVVIHDKQKDYNRDSANREKMMRKTNSYLERETLDGFLREGMAFDEAYSATMSEMVKQGYDPCIPKEAYGKQDAVGCDSVPLRGETSWVDNPGKYDSDTVKRRRDEHYGDARFVNRTNTSDIYNNFPTNEFEYSQDLKRSTLKLQAIEKGKFFIYPGYGTCEVIGHNYNTFGTKGTYTVRVVKTGEIVHTIRIGDNKIRHMNDNFWN